MLAALGDGFALNGTEHSLRRRTLDALGVVGVLLAGCASPSPSASTATSWARLARWSPRERIYW